MISRIGVSLAVFLAIDLTASAADVTYTKDVAPILFHNCSGCHRPGEVSPFSLLSYKDASKRADQLVEATAKRVMPPWKAEHGYGVFRDERRLSDKDLATLAAWAKAGAPEGDPGDLPPTPKFPEGWPLGKPDLVVKMAKPFELPAEGRDQIRVIPLPLELPGDAVISAIDFRPGNRKIVHHALVVVDNLGLMRDRSTPAAKQANPPKDGNANRNALAGLLQLRNGAAPFAFLGSWVPGSSPQFLPEGYGVKVAKDSKVVLQMHYHPVGKAETDQSEVAFYFSKKSEAKSIHTLMMGGPPLVIPAGEKRHKVAATFTLPVDVTVHSVSPHMHQLGREMKAEVTLPDGKTKPLIWIKEWDWNWQGRYTYQSPVALPKGTRIDLEAYYDNSTGNPTNPNSPPKTVRWGEQTTDEMFLCFMQITTASDEDAATLRRAQIQQRLESRRGQMSPKKDP